MEKNDNNKEVWDDENTIDFFGELETISKDNPNIQTNFSFEEEKVEPTKIDDEGGKNEEEEKEEIVEEDAFKEFEEPDLKVTKKEEEENITPYSIAEKLKDLGIIDYEIEEGEDISEEDLLKTAIDKTVYDKLSDMLSQLPDELKKANKYVLNGGSFKEYLEKSSDNPLLIEEKDIEDENYQIALVKSTLEKEGYEEDYIKDHIDFLKEKDKLKVIAEKTYNKLVKEKENLIKSKQQEKELLQKEEKERIKATINIVKKTISDNETIGGLKLSDKDREILPKYMTNKTVKISANQYITPMQRDLQRVLSSESGAVQLAKLIKHVDEKGNIDLSFIERVVENKIVNKKIKENKKSKSKSIVKNSLADYF